MTQELTGSVVLHIKEENKEDLLLLEDFIEDSDKKDTEDINKDHLLDQIGREEIYLDLEDIDDVCKLFNFCNLRYKLKNLIFDIKL